MRRRKLRARGYLDLDLGALPREMLAAWDDLLARAPVDVYVVADAGLPCATLRVAHGGTVALGIDTSGAKLPDLAARLRTLPFEWRGFYASQVVAPRATARGGDELRIHAEGTLVVKALHIEPGIRRSAALDDAFDRALDRLRRTIGLEQVRR